MSISTTSTLRYTDLTIQVLFEGTRLRLNPGAVRGITLLRLDRQAGSRLFLVKANCTAILKSKG